MRRITSLTSELLRCLPRRSAADLELTECSMSGQPIHRSPPPTKVLADASDLYPMVHDPNLLQIASTISSPARSPEDSLAAIFL